MRRFTVGLVPALVSVALLASAPRVARAQQYPNSSNYQVDLPRARQACLQAASSLGWRAAREKASSSVSTGQVRVVYTLSQRNTSGDYECLYEPRTNQAYFPQLSGNQSGVGGIGGGVGGSTGGSIGGGVGGGRVGGSVGGGVGGGIGGGTSGGVGNGSYNTPGNAEYALRRARSECQLAATNAGYRYVREQSAGLSNDGRYRVTMLLIPQATVTPNGGGQGAFDCYYDANRNQVYLPNITGNRNGYDNGGGLGGSKISRAAVQRRALAQCQVVAQNLGWRVVRLDATSPSTVGELVLTMTLTRSNTARSVDCYYDANSDQATIPVLSSGGRRPNGR